MTVDVTYRQGHMRKDPRTMTPVERAKWELRCARQARDYLFSIGQPLVYRRSDGHTVAEYEDERIVVVR